jgi:predicted metal-dependent hydrolase
MDPAWIRGLPEFAYAANGISLLMPYAEPLFIRAAQSALPDLPPELQERTEAYIRQEAGHYKQHKKFNRIVRDHHPRVAWVERWMARCAAWVGRRSRRFNLAFATGGEVMSFLLARWVEKQAGYLFRDSAPVPTTLFLWHLAEEVEHKTAAAEVYEAIDGSKVRYALAMVTAVAMTGVLAWLSAMVQLRDDGKLFSPVSHWRLLRWAVSLAFVMFPAMLVSALPGHSPRDFADPIFLPDWLGQYDPESETMPLWASAGRSA